MAGTLVRPEYELLLLLSQPTLSDEERAKTLALLDHPFDFEAFFDAAMREGTICCNYYRLKNLNFAGLKPDLVRNLRAAVGGIARRNATLTNALLELLKELETAGIAVMPYKGPVLAKHVYGDIGMRVFQDLDIIVRETDRIRSHDILTRLGYRYHPRPDSVINRQANRHEAHYSRPGTDAHPNIFLDLHWEFTPPHFYVALTPWQGSYTHVTLHDRLIKHWQAEDLLLLLCVHGGKDGWVKLMWIVDIASLIKNEPSLRFEAVLHKARGIGALRLVLVGLELAHTLLNTPLPKNVSINLQADQMTQKLVTQHVRNLLSPKPTHLNILRYRARIRERFIDKLLVYVHAIHYLVERYLFPNHLDREFVQLPGIFKVFYIFVRPLRLLINQACRKS